MQINRSVAILVKTFCVVFWVLVAVTIGGSLYDLSGWFFIFVPIALVLGIMGYLPKTKLRTEIFARPRAYYIGLILKTSKVIFIVTVVVFIPLAVLGFNTYDLAEHHYKSWTETPEVVSQPPKMLVYIAAVSIVGGAIGAFLLGMNLAFFLFNRESKVFRATRKPSLIVAAIMAICVIVPRIMPSIEPKIPKDLLPLLTQDQKDAYAKARHGDVAAEEYLGKTLVDSGNPDLIRYGYTWLATAANSHQSGVAEFEIAKALDWHGGLGYNNDAAVNFYNRAIEHGNQDAKQAIDGSPAYHVYLLTKELDAVSLQRALLDYDFTHPDKNEAVEQKSEELKSKCDEISQQIRDIEATGVAR